MNIEKTYGPKLVCRSVGISQRQLGYWSLIGVITPTKQVHGSKIFNRYTDEDIETLRKVKKLTEEGFFVSKAAKKIHQETIEVEPAMKESDLVKEKPLSISRKDIGLSSSLYLEIRLNEELARVKLHHVPLSCMAVRILFPLQFNQLREKSQILFQLSNLLTARKDESDVISFKKDSIFIWLLPNKTIEQAHLFSKGIKKVVEESEWEIQGRKFRLKALFGFSGYRPTSKKDESILFEAEQDLNGQMINEGRMNGDRIYSNRAS